MTPVATQLLACDDCLRRSWLLARLSGHLEPARGYIEAVLALSDEELVAAVGGEQRVALLRGLDDVKPGQLRELGARAGLGQICRCDPRYPRRLADLRAPPAVIHIAGGLERFLEMVDGEPVALVGTRRPSPVGNGIARSLGRGLTAAGLTVISGMAMGVDSAAHGGALAVGGRTLAVLPASPNRPYPPSKRRLYAEIVATGAAVSELGAPAVRRWMFPARNRLIAALASTTVVVEAGERSGALLTAGFAQTLGRPVGAVPGSVGSPATVGSNGLLADGAYVARSPQDVLDAIYGAGARVAKPDSRPELASEQRRLLAALGLGLDSTAALARSGYAVDDGLAALAALELAGYVRRGPGGRFTVIL